MHLVFEHADGSVSAIPVNDMSTVHVQTWQPAVFGDGGVGPRLVEDQTVALDSIRAVRLGDPSGDVQVLSSAMSGPEEISDEEAARLDAEWETAPAIVADQPWDGD